MKTSLDMAFVYTAHTINQWNSKRPHPDDWGGL